MEHRNEKILRDGIRNDYPDYLIKTVSDSPYAIAAMRKMQSFAIGRGLNDDDIANLPINEQETFADFHAKIARDYMFSGRFAILIVPNARGEITSIYHIPFEAVRWGIPDKTTKLVSYVGVNYKFNTSDYKPSETKHFPLFSPSRGFSNLREDIERFQEQCPGEYYDERGHIWFYSDSSEKNRIYSRPSYFSAQDWMKVDAKIGAFHERNTDNNFFLGGVVSIVGDPAQGILNEDGEEYTTVGAEFEKQLSEVFSGSAEAGRFMISWIQNPEDAMKVEAWPGSTHHDLFGKLEQWTQERLAVSIGLPKILLGVPQAGSLGDNQQIRNAISFTNENTQAVRDKLVQTYQVLLDLMNGVANTDDLEIVKIRDFTDLPESIVVLLSNEQRDEYLMQAFGIEPAEEQETELEIPEEDGNTTD